MLGRADLRIALALTCSLIAISGSAGEPSGETPIWLEMSPPVRPVVGGATFGVAYDSVHRRVLLPEVGGDVWSYDGTSWSMTNGTGPPSTPPIAAFDRARGVLVTYTSPDTWEWNGSAWNPTAPGGPPLARIVFHERLGKLVGVGSLLTDPLAVYVLDGGKWSLLPGASPPSARSLFGLSYDIARDRLVLFGGVTSGGGPGGVTDETWEWDGATWTLLSPVVRPAARSAELAYDVARGRSVLFAGATALPGPLVLFHDTWEWDGVRWLEQKPASGPEPRAQAHVVYDESRRRVVMVGQGDGAGTANDVWEYFVFGGACATSDRCDTGLCDNGICCHDACDVCQRCDATGVGCVPVRATEDPDTCSGTRTCDAAGRCKLKGAQACAFGSDCASGECVAGSCCSAHCAPYACTPDGACTTRCATDGDCADPARCRAGACLAVPSTCTGAHVSRSTLGVEQDCTPFACDTGQGTCRATCVTSDDCADGFLCTGGGVCRSAPPAAAASCSTSRRGGTSGALLLVLSWASGVGWRRWRRRYRMQPVKAT